MAQPIWVRGTFSLLAVLAVVYLLVSDGDLPGVAPHSSHRGAQPRQLCRSVADVTASLHALVARVGSDAACTGPEGARTCDPAKLWPVAPPRLPPWTEADEERYAENMVTKPSFTLHAGVGAQWYGGAYLDFAIAMTFFIGDGAGLGDAPVLKGTFLEAGGSNGVHASNSLFFEKSLQWTGVLLEPTTCALCEIVANRVATTSLHGAICGSEGVFNTSGVENFCRDVDLAPTCPAAVAYNAAHGNSVRCAPLSSYLADVGMKRVDFFTLDVEEHAMTALRSFDWEGVDVGVITVECGEPACGEFLRSKGFSVVEAKDGPWATSDDLVAWRNAPGCTK